MLNLKKGFHRMLDFKVIAESTKTKARACVFRTPHGPVETPVFMPVGTLGTVKSLSPEELKAAGARIILGNTYHLYLRPGYEVIDRFSGLHRFMNWDGPILTDSGGFQIFSLAKLSNLSEAGVFFQSHIDGSGHVLTPEKAIDIQLCLNSDIMMCLDVCIAYPASRDKVQQSLETTTDWARRCKTAWKAKKNAGNALFGIVQGGMYADLRRESVDALSEMDFDGYAVGGLSVGESRALMLDIAGNVLPILPEAKPKYIMGVGTPEDLIELVALGADMFDCVLPTRNARNGQLFTRNGKINICNSRFKNDTDPVEAGCLCYTCLNYSRAYLRHLYMARELLAYRLHSIHNIYFYTDFIKQMREAIIRDAFEDFKKEFYRAREA